ncbi:hypothetical protein CACET_c33870 [Clostridium aceticum]|uniref:Uncharacterized protein n=1 Tax=Clostridium aceticum TaxID=84022 RepID=A0A0D8IBC3_9CLOT|nr:hypothetical protein [Clostridium aceticum]AKL96830.1 hypothetical protein CACET_c33870 [Clostridium aceticum]KJF27578.1 hypothetical protein TZ02_07280 [Clostridium aceticum]
MIFFIIFILLCLTLLDLPFLLQYNKSNVTITYLALVLIGIAISYIVVQEVPVTSPAVLIEKIVVFVIGRV